MKDPGELLEGVLAADRIALAQAITLVESKNAADQDAAASLLDACLRVGRKSLRIGITGVPGAGKSSLIDALGMSLVRDGHRVAVLAVDPTSAVTGGSILGDKTRMRKLSARPEAFVRPSASGGHGGGITRSTREAAVVCEAAGFEYVIVETVGTGQGETALVEAVDALALIVLTGAGDELQGMKRGILELADIILVGKADGANQSAAADTEALYREACRVFPGRPFGWRPLVQQVSASSELGLDTLRAALSRFWQEAVAAGYFEDNRQQQAAQQLRDEIGRTLTDRALRSPRVLKQMDTIRAEVESARISVRTAISRILD